VCYPGSVAGCGNCGTMACDSCGQWGGCTGQGVCSPGSTEYYGCYMGYLATCDGYCQWSCP
jgi:hypothetical protein